MLAEDPLTYNHKLMIPVIRTMTRMQSSAKVYLMVSSDMITDAMRDYALNEGCDLFWLMNASAWRLENGALQPVAPEAGSRRSAGPAPLRTAGQPDPPVRVRGPHVGGLPRGLP